MKTVLRAVSALCVATIVAAFIAIVMPGLQSVHATYSYYFTDSFAPESFGANVSPRNWIVVNGVSQCPAFNGGLTTNPNFSDCGVLLMSNVAPASQEVMITFGFGTEIVYLGAQLDQSNNLLNYGWTVTATGSGITVAKMDPDGTSWNVASATGTLTEGMQVRSILTHGGLALYVNNSYLLSSA